MSELAAYLKKNIKLAAKSVWYHRGQYLCFFIAMLVTEIFCGLAVMAAHNNNVLERKYIAAEYDYNLELRNLNTDQYYYMLNDDYTVFTSDHIYDVVRTETHINEVTGEKTYNLFIKFLGDSKTNYDTFSKRYFNDLSALDKNGRLAIAASALQKIDSRISANAADNVTIFILVTLLSIGLVTALYNIRINYYKFEYGIYMTFGADFKRLFVTSLWEMFIIAAVVYIPAVIFSALISAVVYGYAGESFEFFAAAPLYIFVFALIVAGMSVLLPIWRLSRRTPMANIIAEDNSNLIVSPRISFEMLGKNYPRGYELISAWRFRLYNLRLYALTAFFTVLVTMLIFSAGMIRQNEIIDYPQFKILLTDKHSYDGGTPNGFMRDELLKIPGVTGIEKKQEVFAFNTNSFVMFDPSNTTFLSDFPLYHEKYRATYHAVYKPADSEVVEILSKYKFTGDLNSVLTNEKTVIISDSLGNIKRLNIKPGDKIRISKFVKK